MPVRIRAAGPGDTDEERTTGVSACHITASYTVLNFVVPDVVAAVETLAARGVRFLRYDEYGADERGIVRRDGRALAWFTDPAGNIHSVIGLEDPLPVPREV